MSKKWVRSIASLVAIVSISFLMGCQKQQSAGNDKLQVVSTTNFYGEVAKAVGGEHVQVKSVITQPSVDPHDYEPTTAIAKQVGQADVVVANGLGYDHWMNKLVKSTNQATFVRVGEDVLGKKTGANAHLWYRPKTMQQTATYLAKTFAKQQPENAATFKANAKRYVAKLKPVTQELTAIKQRVAKLPTKQVYVSEPVFDYSLTAVGLTVANANFERAVEKGTDPAPKVIQQMQTGIANHKVALFVQNKQVSDPIVKTMVKRAQQANVPVLDVTETMPAKTSYQSWMLQQYKQLNQLLASTAAK